MHIDNEVKPPYGYDSQKFALGSTKYDFIS